MPVRLVALAVLALALDLRAAPAPVEPPDDNPWTRALAEDTDVLLHFDIKQFMASPLVQKELKGKLPAILADRFVFPVRLKPLGIDPTKDIRTMVMAQCRGDWLDKDGKPSHQTAGIILLHTTRTEAALKASFAAAAKAGKGSTEASEGAHNFYEVKGEAPGVAAVLPGGVIALAPNRLTLVRALDRVKAAKRPALKSAEMAKFVKGLKAGPFLRGLILGEAVTGVSSNFGGGMQPKVTLNTLSESGFDGVRIEATLKGTIKGHVDLLCKDAGTAEKKAKEITGGIVAAQLFVGQQVMAMAQLKVLIKILDSAKATSNDKTVRVEGEIEAEAVAALDLIPLPPGDDK